MGPRTLITAETVGDQRPDGVEREDILPDDGVGGGRQPLEVGGIGIGLAQSDQARIGIQLDYRAQREGLVHTDRVEQRRVGERDRGDARPGDADSVAGHQCTASAASASASTARPAAMILRSSARSSGVGGISGGRTGPTSRPSSVTPALINDTG